MSKLCVFRGEIPPVSVAAQGFVNRNKEYGLGTPFASQIETNSAFSACQLLWAFEILKHQKFHDFQQHEKIDWNNEAINWLIVVSSLHYTLL